METTRNSRKEILGTVTSAKMDKTIVVAVVRSIKHPKYGKYFKKTKKYTAHDETNQCGENDMVRNMETRPMRKTKRWRRVEIVEKAK